MTSATSTVTALSTTSISRVSANANDLGVTATSDEVAHAQSTLVAAGGIVEGETRVSTRSTKLIGNLDALEFLLVT